MELNSKQSKVLALLFSVPPPAGMKWDEVESLLHALGCTIQRGRRGSRLKVRHGTKLLSMHEPHNPRTLKAYQVEDLRKFLTSIGVTLQ